MLFLLMWTKKKTNKNGVIMVLQLAVAFMLSDDEFGGGFCAGMEVSLSPIIYTLMFVFLFPSL